MKQVPVLMIVALSTALYAGCGAGSFADRQGARSARTSLQESRSGADAVPAVISSVVADSHTTIMVTFSEEPDAASMALAANYLVRHTAGNPIAVWNVALLGERTAILRVSAGMTHGNAYSLEVRNIVDRNGRVLPDAIHDFTGRGKAIALLTGVPASITGSGSIGIIVGGADVVEYKYSLDGGEWSGEIPVSVPIIGTGLSKAEHTLRVVGKDSMHNWQDFSEATSVAWTVDDDTAVAWSAL